MAENPTQRCIICSVADPNLSVCRDVSSWETLLHAAQVRNHKTILDVIVGENGMPEFSVSYHRSCRATFTHKKDLLKLSEPIPHQNQQSSSQRSSSRDTSPSSSVILPNRCIFCKKEKYKPRSSTREKTRSCMEFRSDDKVRSSAKLHIKTCSELSSIANEVLALCFKDLISSEAKYHASCYKSFVRISYADTPNLEALERKKDTVDSISLHDQVYEAAYSFCSDLIKSPRIVEMKAIKDIMSAEAERIGIEVLPSQFKNLVRKLSNKFQGDLKFAYPSYNKVLVYPSTLTVDEVVGNYFEIRAQIDSLQNLDKDSKDVIKVAKMLNSEVKAMKPQMSWPPKDDDLKPNMVPNYIPRLLDLFCTVLLSGESNETERKKNEKVVRLSNSICQDIVYIVSNGNIKTPKSVLFPVVVKSLCNNTEVIKLINRHGHGISYNLIEEIETEHALKVLNEQKEMRVAIPDEAIKCGNSPVSLMVADNIDNLESTLTGAGTSHRVNSILVGKRRRTEKSEDADAPGQAKKKCKRSLPKDAVAKEIPDYYGGKRVGPGELVHVSTIYESEKYCEMLHRQLMKYLAWIEVRKLKTHPTLLVPGWTGFNIIVRNEVVVVESVISYLDTIDSPATDLKTAYEVLCRGCEIKERLNLVAVACVFDQAFYAKAMEIYWKHKDKFKNLIIMLGGFHLLMMLFGVIGARFGDAGLREVVIQSDLIAGGSIDSVLNGKHYNRAVRLHKVVYEALMKLLVDKFESLLSSAEDKVILEQQRTLMETFKLDMAQESFENVLASDEFLNWFSKFKNHIQNLRDNGSNLVKFWLSYLHLCELVLNLVYATRTGDWELYLACIEEVIPWAFAYDRLNYARYLIPFLNDMRELPFSKPEVYSAFLNGEFSVQMSHTNTFGGNEADKTIENTINRDCKTSGGYIGFSANFSATQRWVLNASRRGAYRKLLREHLSFKPESYTHKELSKSRIKKDIEDVEKVIDVLSNVLTNPWCGKELISLSSGMEATDAVRQDLLEAKSIGLKACEHFINDRCSSNPTLAFFDTLKKAKLKTFKNLKKTLNVKTNQQIVPLKMDRNIFARMALLGQFRKIDLKLVFTFPLGPLPWSLSDAYGFPRKTNKAALLHRLEKDVPMAETYPQHVNTIFDGMAVLQKFVPPAGATFQVLAEKVFDMVTSNPSTRIDVVFDVYKDISIKNAERHKRTSQSDGAKYKNLEAGFQIKSWKSFMAHSGNKVEIVKFLVTKWKDPKFIEKLGNKSLYVTLDEKCWRIDSSGAVVVSELECNHEEADTRIILHAKHAQGPYLVHADDTDVLVLLLCHAPLLHHEGYMKLGKGSKSRIIQIHLILQKLLKELHPEISSQDFIKSLIGLHAFTGCDSTSSFSGKGKMKALKLLVNNVKYVEGLSKLGVSWDVSDELVDALEEFVCDLYGRKGNNVNLLRYQLHCAKGGKVEPESLPPCRSSLKMHILRANYQAGVWRKAVSAAPDIPSPHGHGWEVSDGNIAIKWLDSKPAPEEILEMLSCMCKKACRIDTCCCLKAGLKCTDLCLLECEHMVSEELHQEGQDYSDDEDIDYCIEAIDD